ncbi:sugar phosphate isomerase/epimerase family protein [Novisyntrophococcus fermenticellae]|uniref:sugar phosphate isomerase/epimerase family protein n=1 Tax=Novisyntrophococcus fermenticellae TaxID=2068655 RepID=UPI0022A829B3|nr:TIM barrel protein [Novisyntrophococcus fermenticellae]
MKRNVGLELTSNDIVEMIQDVNSTSLAGIIDTAVLGYSGETIERAIQILGNHLRHVHFADGIPNGHFILGEGELPLFEMLQALDNSNYKGRISLEILNNLYVEDPESAMQKSFDWLLEHISD